MTTVILFMAIPHNSFRFVSLLRAKYNTNEGNIQPLFLDIDSNSKQCLGIYQTLVAG